MKLVLVNLSDPASANVSARQVNVDLGGKFKKADFIRLIGPALDARTGMTLAGKTVTAEGTFPPITPKRLPVVKGNSLKLNLPPGSATLITLVSATRPIAQAR